MLHKPAGTVTTAGDPQGRRTVYDLLPPAVRELDLSYVGRLDRDTEGLLLLTNEGDVMNRLLHPSGEVEREYEAGVSGVPEASTLERLEAGVDLEDGPARAREARLLRREGGGAASASGRCGLGDCPRAPGAT
jgi:pseudouridine synthase